MEINVASQSLVYVMSMICGALIGVVYDFFRVMRLTFSKNKLIIFFEDILFCVLCAILVYGYIFVANSGEVRLFIFTGLLLGALLYYFTIGKIVYFIFNKMINFIENIFHSAALWFNKKSTVASGVLKVKIKKIRALKQKIPKIKKKPRKKVKKTCKNRKNISK